MKKQTGFTLIEIMISLLLGILVVGSTLAIYISSIQGSSDTMKSDRLNHDLEAAMAIMINDFRRAGYWGGAIAGSDAVENPYVQANPLVAPALVVSNLQIMDFTETVSGDVHTNGCILYSYDANDNATYDTSADNTDNVGETTEFYGFRIDRGAIWMRTSGNTTADCTQGAWQRFSDENQVNIPNIANVFTSANSCLNVRTGKSYPLKCIDNPNNNVTTDDAEDFAGADGDAATDFQAGDRLVEIRQVDITLNGQLVDDATVQKTITGSVRVRNNRHFVF